MKQLYVKVNGTEELAETNDKELIIIPLDTIQKMPLKEKYDFMRDCMNTIIRSEVVVKKKWYQRVLPIVFLFVSFFINPLATVVAFLASTVIGLVTNNKYIKLAVQVALIVYGGYKAIQSGKATLFDRVLFSIQLTNELFQFKIQSLTDKTTKQISQIQKETQDYSEQIQEIQRRALYQPLDLVDTYYELLYNFQYDQLDQLSLMCQVDTSMYEGLR